MKIDVYHTPLGLNAGDLTGRAVVVIDVLRATSTIVTALAAVNLGRTRADELLSLKVAADCGPALEAVVAALGLGG